MRPDDIRAYPKMIAILIIICLLTILVVFISSLIYFVSILIDSEDDNVRPPPLAIDAHEFNISPAISPNDDFAALKLGLPLDSRNKRNETAVHVAVRKNKLQVLIGLLCHNANIEARNETGETPLIVACRVSNIFACQLLLVFDADFEARDKFGLSARHYIAHTCHKTRNLSDQPTPSASHLILAMLNAIGARRCPDRVASDLEKVNSFASDVTNQQKILVKATDNLAKDKTTLGKAGAHSTQIPMKQCCEGCSADGKYDGNSYNRWTKYSKESLYKRHMFSEIIESRLKQSKLSRVWRWSTNADRQQKSRLLSIDGGGLRGVIVCQMMIEAEKYLKRPMIEYFDWVGGTSVGGFLACALCNGKSLTELRRICFDVKDEVFSGQKKPYNSKFIERVLRRTYGSETRMSDIKGKKLAITATLADRDPCQLRFFRNYKSPTQLLESQGFAAEMFNNMSAHSLVSSRLSLPTNQSDARSTNNKTLSEPKHVSSTTEQISQKKRHSNPMKSSIKSLDDDSESTRSETSLTLNENDTDPYIWQAVRASAAAPFFFRPYGPFVDGGIISNNPTLDLLVEVESYKRVREFLKKKPIAAQMEASDQNLPRKLDLVVSLGTGRGRVIGRQAMIDFSQVASGFATVFSPVELVRSIKAARDLFKKLIQQSCHTEDHIIDRAQAWCSSLSIPYFRVSPPLTTIFSIDDKRDEQLINALWQTKLYMRSMRPQLEELAQILDSTS